MIHRLLAAAAVAGALVLTACESTPSKDKEPASTQASTASMGMVNGTCPMSGQPVDPNARTVSFEGHKVGFCCDDCAGPWEAKSNADKAAYIASQK